MTDIKLYDHQKLALSHMRYNGNFALFLEQGLGKTLIALTRILELIKEGEVMSALVVCPKATMGAWYRDIDLFSPEDRALLEPAVCVINYDSVWRENKGYDQEWDCIILDESHKIKNRTSKRAAFLLKLACKSKYRFILTGTPIGNGRLENIWSQYAFLYPELYRGRVRSQIFGSYTNFCDKYCILDQYWQPYRYTNIDQLQDIIDKYSYRATKVDCLDLPDKLPDEIYDIELKEKKLYRELEKTNVLEKYDLLVENPLAKMTKLRQIASGFITDEDGVTHPLKCEKIAVLEDFLEDWEKKLVIYCDYKYSIKKVSALLDKLKLKYVVLDGDQENKLIWRNFQSDKSIQIIVCQYQSASEGIDLYAADTIVYYEPTLSSTILEQSRDRIHRVGQSQKCSYIHFLSRGTIEVPIYKALKNYSDFSTELFEYYIKEYTRSYSGGR